MGLKGDKAKNKDFIKAQETIIGEAPLIENVKKIHHKNKPAEEYVVQISFRLKKKLLEQTREYSKIEELSVNRFIIQCIKEKIERMRDKQ